MACSSCFRGGISSDVPTGTEETIHGLPTYVARPDEGVTPKGLVIFITDAFGWKFVNNRVLSDRYAKRGGYLVYCPNVMNGGGIDESSIPLMDSIMEPSTWTHTIFIKPFLVMQAIAMFLPWFMRSNIGATKSNVLKFVQDIRRAPPPFETTDLKVAAAGFCWGGKHVFTLAADAPSSRVVRYQAAAGASAPALW